MLFQKQLLYLAAVCGTFMLALGSSKSKSKSSSSSSSLPRMKDFLVEGLDEVEPEYSKFEGKMYAGRLPIDNGDRHGDLMFWFFAPDDPFDKNSVTIWLNGGGYSISFFYDGAGHFWHFILPYFFVIQGHSLTLPIISFFFRSWLQLL